MKKIQFKNLPDKTTPISADNLNQLQDNVSEAILNPVVESIECKNLLNLNNAIAGVDGDGISEESKYTNLSTAQKLSLVHNVASYDYFPFQVVVHVKSNTNYTLKLLSNTLDFSTVYIYGNKLWENRIINGDASNGITFNTGSYTTIVIGFYLTSPSIGTTYSISNIQLEEGSTASSYTPYKKYGYNSQESMGSIVVDDIRSKNLFNINNLTLQTGSVDYSTGTINVNQYANTSLQTLKQLAPDLKAGKEYTLSFNTTSHENYIYLNGSSSGWSNNTTRILTQDELDDIVFFYGEYESSAQVTISDIQIEEGITATDYSKYINFEGKEEHYIGHITPTNKYYDGKRSYLYQVNLTSPNVLNEDVKIIPFPTKITGLYDIRGIITLDGYYIPVNGTNISAFIYENYIALAVQKDVFKNKPVTVTIEFSKD